MCYIHNMYFSIGIEGETFWEFSRKFEENMYISLNGRLENIA